MSQVVVEMTGEEAKLWRAQAKIIAQTKKMEGAYQKVGRAGKSAGGQVQKSFGNQASAKLVTYAKGLIGVSGAARLIGSSMQFVRVETDKAIARVIALKDARRALAQVATSSADLESLNRRSDALAGKHGVDRDIARDVMFAGRSEGFEAAVPRILEHGRVVDPRAAAHVAGQVDTLFKGFKVSPLEAINATLAAAQKSRLNFEGIAKNLPIASEGAAFAGSSPAEAAGLLSVFANQFASGSTAADRLKAFGTKVGISDQFKGKGIVGAAKELQGLPADQRRAFLGESQELNSAFSKLVENMGEIETRIVEIDRAMKAAGTPASALAQAQRAIFDPDTNTGRTSIAERNLAIARIRRELANEQQLAERGAGQKAAIDNVLAEMKEAGMPGFKQSVADWAAWALQGLGAPDRLITTAGRASTVSGSDVLFNLPGELKRIFAPSGEEFTSAAERLNAAARNLESATEKSSSFANSQRARQRVAGGSVETQ